ncbi:MAG: hypothetical protein DLM56_08980 [Pseudonocardiales bacterium]|nr:MAG: hypothetical protein DLM56_08980 [Pseudonocardiales bacterium]
MTQAVAKSAQARLCWYSSCFATRIASASISGIGAMSRGSAHGPNCNPPPAGAACWPGCGPCIDPGGGPGIGPVCAPGIGPGGGWWAPGSGLQPPCGRAPGLGRTPPGGPPGAPYGGPGGGALVVIEPP